MTAETLDTVTTASDKIPAQKAYTVERPRFPLVFKLFLLTALLIVIVVGVAVGITIQRANSVADETVKSSIASAAKLFRDFEEQRLGRLASATQLLGSDSNFSGYIQATLQPQGTLLPEAGAPPADPNAPPAAAEPDIASITDQLLQNRERLGTDVMMLLD
ncbi:MAG TPA: hypothetical protein VFO89_08285, partial [Thermoanaerobaculia bacterium]|nr:hypothetical protein [Thermoanaerobaculia bacterium]